MYDHARANCIEVMYGETEYLPLCCSIGCPCSEWSLVLVCAARATSPSSNLPSLLFWYRALLSSSPRPHAMCQRNRCLLCWFHDCTIYITAIGTSSSCLAPYKPPISVIEYVVSCKFRCHCYFLRSSLASSLATTFQRTRNSPLRWLGLTYVDWRWLVAAACLLCWLLSQCSYRCVNGDGMRRIDLS